MNKYPTLLTRTVVRCGLAIGALGGVLAVTNSISATHLATESAHYASIGEENKSMQAQQDEAGYINDRYLASALAVFGLATAAVIRRPEPHATITSPGNTTI